MQELLASVGIIGSLLLLGGGSFRLLFSAKRLTGDAGSPESCDFSTRRFITMLGIGLVLMSLAQVGRPPALAVIEVLLAAVIVVAHWLCIRNENLAMIVIALSASLGLVAVLAGSSHAASEPGWLPVLVSALHWIAASIWAGGLLHLTVQIWKRAAATPIPSALSRLPQRYSALSLFALALLVATGGLLAFVHIHNADALSTSHYGAVFRFKVLASSLLTVTVSFIFVRIAPACLKAHNADARRIAFGKFRLMAAAELALLLAVILSTGVLSTQTPVGTAPFLNPQAWDMRVGATPLRINLQPVAGRAGQVRLEIKGADEDVEFPEGTLATMTVLTPTGSAGLRDVEAIPIGPAEFLGETMLAVPGDWEFTVTLDFPNGDTASSTQTIAFPGPPLQQDMRAYLKVTTIFYSTANIATFVVGLSLLVVAAWTMRLAMTSRAPYWLLTAGLANAAFGGFLLLSVMFVKTYPSSFWPNPAPYTAAIIQAGEADYRSHCADCHGPVGQGDGPWALATRGSLPDLTAPHMDSHTDGEIFWWVRHGIPTLDMPPLAGELTESETWVVINYVRSLRHGVPRHE